MREGCLHVLQCPPHKRTEPSRSSLLYRCRVRWTGVVHPVGGEEPQRSDCTPTNCTIAVPVRTSLSATRWSAPASAAAASWSTRAGAVTCHTTEPRRLSCLLPVPPAACRLGHCFKTAPQSNGFITNCFKLRPEFTFKFLGGGDLKQALQWLLLKRTAVRYWRAARRVWVRRSCGTAPGRPTCGARVEGRRGGRRGPRGAAGQWHCGP